MTAPFTKEQKDKITSEVCAELSIGRSLKNIADSMKLTYSWLYNLLHEPEYKDNYTRAREEQADKFAQEIIEIADTETDSNKARVRIDARKWIACKMLPKLYGDKLTHDGAVNMKHTIDWSKFTKAEILAMAGLPALTMETEDEEPK